MTIHSVTNATEFSAARGAAVGGDIIELAPGNYGAINTGSTYSGEVIWRSADSLNPAVLTSVAFDGVSNVTIDGLEFDGGGYLLGGQALDVMNSNNVKCLNSHIHDISNGAFYRWANNCTFENNYVHDIRSDGLQMYQVDGLLVDGNTFSRHFPAALDHADMIQSFTSSQTQPTRNVTVTNNFLNAADGNWTQSMLFGDEGSVGYENVNISNNLIYNGHTHGISIWNVNGLTIENNTLLSNFHSFDTRPLIVNQLAGDSGIVSIQNNIVTDTLVGVEGTPGAGQTVANNVIAQRTNPAGANYYGDLFENAMADGAAVLADFKTIPGSAADGVGSSLANNGTTIPPVEPPMADTITITSIDAIRSTPNAPAATAVIEVNNTITIDPNDPDYTGVIEVDYTITDAETPPNTASATIFATFSGTPPVANDDSVTVAKGAVVNIDPKLNDTAD